MSVRVTGEPGLMSKWVFDFDQIEHSRHRSPINFLINLLCGLIAYCHRPKKPSLNLGTLPALIALPEFTLKKLGGSQKTTADQRT